MSFGMGGGMGRQGQQPGAVDEAKLMEEVRCCPASCSQPCSMPAAQGVEAARRPRVARRAPSMLCPPTLPAQVQTTLRSQLVQEFYQVRRCGALQRAARAGAQQHAHPR